MQLNWQKHRPRVNMAVSNWDWAREDVVPFEPTNICDIGLPALGCFGHKDANIAL
jgi:hypothetical protein